MANNSSPARGQVQGPVANSSPSQPQGQAGAVVESFSSQPDVVVYCKLCLSEHPSVATSTLHTCDCVFCTRIACFAPADQVELYQRLEFEQGTVPFISISMLLDPSRAWCPVLECQAVCSVGPSSEGQPTSVPCPACHTVFCSGCRGPWQDGHACPEHQPMTSSSPDSESRGRSCSDSDLPIKPCPMCGVYIERNQGCAQMLCKSCKHTFCWYCLQNLDGDIFLRHYDKGPCRNKLGHSRASVMWNRTQVVGILVGVSVIVLVASPLLLLASPCILCCLCKPCRGNKKRRRKKEVTQTDIQPEPSPTKS
ncbi:unnamed protein product [Coregonus sp. 'balchen']|nr:unnamed protein product [Coregonus sp. 'balchen']